MFYTYKKTDLARHIASKYKDITIVDAKAFIDLIVEEMIYLIRDKCATIELPGLVTLKVIKTQKNGFDFTTNKYIRDGGDMLKYRAVPSISLRRAIKEKLVDLPKHFKEE